LGRWYGVLMEAVLPTEEMSLARDMAVPIDCGANLADILSNALPPDKRSHDKDKPLSDSSVSLDPPYRRLFPRACIELFKNNKEKLK